ncbi:MAG TPA: V-type ATPase subunit [Thermoplasmata archaeon]|nr:V-type ATPase subunit [Thermoplasmata archaeon]
MAASPYASALGRLLPDFPAFLSADVYARLVAARDAADVAKILEGTSYAADLDAVRATHTGIGLVEIAINRTFVRRNRRAFQAAPFAGRPVVGAYLARWDVENIEMILSAKAEHRPVRETEEHLVSSRDIPSGLYAGVLTLDDYRGLLEQPTVDAVATALVRYGYGATILPLLEAFQRSGDIFPILHALDVEYYRSVLGGTRFFQGDEWIVRELVKSEIDRRNALLLLKAKAADLPLEEVAARWIDGGAIPAADAADLFGARGVPELAERLQPRFPSIGEGSAEFANGGSLVGFEAAIERDRAVRELKRLRAYPLSLGVIFAFLLRAEIERGDIRRIAFGKLYGLANERIEPLLVSPRL